jgi:electron transport complex protein RnfC
VNQYDLLSCVECGLCSYVCPARIPLFQHIMLGKHEFTRMKLAEGSHA